MIASPIHLEEARENAKAAFQAALLDGLDLEDRLDATLDAFLTGLAAVGYVKTPQEQPKPAELDNFARRLAALSANRRYEGDGWRLLRQHPDEIMRAYQHACEQSDTNPAELAAYRSLLLAHVQHVEDTV